MLYCHHSSGLSASAPLHHKIYYDMSNFNALIQTDGCFQISKYSIANRFSVFVADSFYLSLTIDGCALPAHAEKEILLLGRMQTVSVKAFDVSIVCRIFLDETSQAIFQQFELTNHTPFLRNIEIHFGFTFDAKSFWDFQTEHKLFNQSSSSSQILGVTNRESRTVRHQILPEWNFDIACSDSIRLREIEGNGFLYLVDFHLPPNKTHTTQLVYRMEDCEVPDPSPASHFLKNFDQSYQNAVEYTQFLSKNALGQSDLEKSLYVSCLNCGLSNYKEMDDFKGFVAGVDHQFPARSYYRDAYFTCLAVMPYKPEWVRNQIITLAMGVNAKGECPSAVISYREVFWPNHIDSPAYFVTLVYEYICYTGDLTVLSHSEDDATILDLILLIANSMYEKADSNHLLYRQSNNRRDWADTVFREGYVTYIQALFYRTLYCTGKLLQLTHSPDNVHFLHSAEKVRQSINRLLWIPEEGRFFNYISQDTQENNLSLDTLFTILYGICEQEQAISLLNSMENQLETIHNPQQRFGNWGTMNCYPFYSHQFHLVEKSSHAYLAHNGSDWPYLSCLYAFIKARFGMEYTYPLTQWFKVNLQQSQATPAACYNPITGHSSCLQAWSSMGAFAIQFATSASLPFDFFGVSLRPPASPGKQTGSPAP